MPPSPPRRLLRWYERLLMGLVGTVLAGLLATAAWLAPSSRGMGTHQQLGLPPCTLVALYGMRCPSCGMTTSWSHLMRGNVFGSVQANAAGFLLGVLALITAPWLLSSALWGRFTVAPPGDWTLIVLTCLVVGVTLGDWLYRLNF